MQYEKEFLRNLYRNLLDMRLLEQKMVDTYAQGRVPGHIHSGVGQEASFVGVLANFKASNNSLHAPRQAVIELTIFSTVVSSP